MPDISRYFKRHNIDPDHIIYVYNQGSHSIICNDAGAEIASTIRMHELIDYLPQNEFYSICRGTLVRLKAIVSISNDGVYTMLDGKTFQGRKRYLSEHKKLRKQLGLFGPEEARKAHSEASIIPLTLLEKCSILDKMPIAYCIIELVFDEKGHGIDFVFRYCNRQMEVVEGVPIEEMVNHSFYEVFKNGDRKWLVAYADVALNGINRVLHDYSPEIGKNLTIYCYQPEEGYCACVLFPE